MKKRKNKLHNFFKTKSQLPYGTSANFVDRVMQYESKRSPLLRTVERKENLDKKEN